MMNPENNNLEYIKESQPNLGFTADTEQSSDVLERFVCISINYKLCDEDFRSCFAFNKDERKVLLLSCYKKNPVLLCTCNRTELYFWGKSTEGIDLLSFFSKVTKEDIKRQVMIFSGDIAVNHLFSVACGIESMVIGEDEILGQLKNSYDFSKKLFKLSPETNMIFQTAIAAAKKIKTKTELSKTSVSVATLAAKEAARFGENITVMLIGASGKIGTSLLKNLMSYKNVSVIVTSRSHNSDFFSYSSDNPKLEIVPYEKRYEYASQCGCIISATASPHYTITADRLLKSLSDIKPRLLIDLAVPNDIDYTVAEIEGISLIGIDYFSKLAAENNAHKLDSVVKSKSIINAEIDELKKQLVFHWFLSDFKEVSLRLSCATAEELLYKLKSKLAYEAFKQVLEVIKEYGDD